MFGACEIKEVMRFFIMLEDCMLDLGVRFIQRFNILENISWSMRDLDVPLVGKENQDISLCSLHFSFLYFCTLLHKFIEIILEKLEHKNHRLKA